MSDINWSLYKGNTVLVDVAKMFKSFSNFQPQKFILKGCNSEKLFVYSNQGGLSGNFEVDANICKLILRSSDQITEIERKRIHEMMNDFAIVEESIVIKKINNVVVVSFRYVDQNDRVISTRYVPIEITDYLTEQGISLRGEIENGTAINEADI